MAFNGWGKMTKVITSEEAYRSGRPVYVESVFGKVKMSSKKKKIKNRISLLNNIIHEARKKKNLSVIYVSMQDADAVVEAEKKEEEGDNNGMQGVPEDSWEISMKYKRKRRKS
jgi:hypothetical protein